MKNKLKPQTFLISIPIQKQGTHSGGVGLIRMVFLGYEQKQYAIPKLDTIQGGHSHVEEDSKQGRHGNHLQDGLHQN